MVNVPLPANDYQLADKTFASEATTYTTNVMQCHACHYFFSVLRILCEERSWFLHIYDETYLCEIFTSTILAWRRLVHYSSS